jgi:hypothetical protein
MDLAIYELLAMQLQVERAKELRDQVLLEQQCRRAIAEKRTRLLSELPSYRLLFALSGGPVRP